MKITRTAKFVNGKMVWEPPFTPAEQAEREASFNAMVASGIPPAYPGSEKTFLHGASINHGLADHPSWMQEGMIRMAHEAGINTHGKVYKGGIADGRGPRDPEAWVSTMQDVLDVAKRRNLTIKSGAGIGGVNHEGVLMPPPPDVALNPRIVKTKMQEMIANNPELATADKRELAEQIIDKHGAPRATRQLKKRGVSNKFVEID